MGNSQTQFFIMGQNNVELLAKTGSFDVVFFLFGIGYWVYIHIYDIYLYIYTIHMYICTECTYIHIYIWSVTIKTTYDPSQDPIYIYNMRD